MADRTSYVLADGIATITMDDGKVNALSPEMLAELHAAFDRAEADGAVVVLTGRARTLSAGFDLRSQDWPAMLTGGATLARRMLAFPRPVVVACNGNALAMGAFLLLAADLRIGTAGDHKLGLNEVAIGLTLPWFGVALAQHRLTRPAFDRCTVTGVVLGPAAAHDAGFLDEVVDPSALPDAARAAAAALQGVDATAHAATKLKVRAPVLAELEDAIARIADPDRDL